jgi:hypothetical protein
MSGSNRHHRVAKKEITEASSAYTCMDKKQKKCAIIIGVMITILVFLKGILIGHLISSYCKSNKTD